MENHWLRSLCSTRGVDDFTEKVLLGISDEVQDVCRKVEALSPGAVVPFLM